MQHDMRDGRGVTVGSPPLNNKAQNPATGLWADIAIMHEGIHFPDAVACPRRVAVGSRACMDGALINLLGDFKLAYFITALLEDGITG